jgi:hypothetical protein
MLFRLSHDHLDGEIKRQIKRHDIRRLKDNRKEFLSTDFTDYTDSKNKKVNGETGQPQRNILFVFVVFCSLNLCNLCNLWI